MSEQKNGKDTRESLVDGGRPGRMPERLRPCDQVPDPRPPPPEKVPAELGDGEEGGRCA